MARGSVIWKTAFKNIPLEVTGKPVLPRIFLWCHSTQVLSSSPPPGLSSAAPVGPLKFHLSVPMCVSEVGLGSALEPHFSPAFIPALSLGCVQAQVLPPGPRPSPPSLDQRLAQGPPKWEGCLSFGLNNHTTPHIFSLNSKAHLLGGSTSSLAWTLIHSIPLSRFFVLLVFKASSLLLIWCQFLRSQCINPGRFMLKKK